MDSRLGSSGLPEPGRRALRQAGPPALQNDISIARPCRSPGIFPHPLPLLGRHADRHHRRRRRGADRPRRGGAVAGRLTGRGAEEGQRANRAAAQAALRGAPPQLASLHNQASDLLQGGKSAFAARRSSLQRPPGHRQRLGLLVRSLPGRVPVLPEGRRAVRQAGRVRGPGRDRQRRRRQALPRAVPCALPVLRRPARHDHASLAATAGLPNTVFYDAKGKRTFVHQGGYTSEAKLAADVKRYALGA